MTATAVPIAAIASLIGLMKSETQLDAVSQTVDAKLLAAAVAGQLKNAVIPSAAISEVSDAALINSFENLMAAADEASNHASKDQLDELKTLITRYDALTSRLLTPDKEGIAPLAAAARLQSLNKNNPDVLRVNTEQAGGTLVKRTNLFTALGGEAVFISGGLVSSYRLTDPKTGDVVVAGVITCRTTLSSLRKVQEASWKSPQLGTNKEPVAVCSK